MSDKELNLPDYIEFTYNRFIMTRVEYLIFTQNEQESKVLRVIEWCIENERARLYREAKARTPQGQKVEISDIVWVPISHRFFLDQLHGTVQSETTLKSILATLKKKHFIFQEPGGTGPYDPPIYTINKHLLADLTKLLPKSLDDLDMTSILKQERKIKKVREGQKLTPSKIDPLVIKIRESINGPLDPQLLALYRSKIAPLSRSTGGQKLPPKIYKDKQEDNKDNITHSSDDSRDTQSSFLQSQLTEQEKTIASLQAMVEQQQQQITQLLQAKAEAVTSLPPVTTETTSPNDTQSQQTQASGDVTQVEAQDSDAVVVAEGEKPAGKGKGRGGSRRGKIATEASDKPAKPALEPMLTDEEKAFKARCSAIYQQIVERRGCEFNTGDDVKAERVIIRDHLAPAFSDAQIAFIHKHLDEKDKYWKLPENQIRISAGIIWREANKVIAFYKRGQKEVPGIEAPKKPDVPEITPFMKRNRELMERHGVKPAQSGVPTLAVVTSAAK